MAIENMNIPEKILLVVKPISKYGYDVAQGYIVDPENRKQLESARSWGKEYVTRYTLGSNTEYEPIEYYTDNNGFQLTILESAGSSSQGGKLSFWNCLIEKGDIKAIVGIDQNSLLSLIKQSTIINGKVQESLSLSKLPNTAGAVHSGMAEWKNSKQNKQNTMGNVKKTTKWELGRSYVSLTKEDMYIGNIYNWIDERTTYVEEPSSHRTYLGRSANVAHYHLKFLDKPEEKVCLSNLRFAYRGNIAEKIKKGEITSVAGIYQEMTNKLSNITPRTSQYSLYECVDIIYHSDAILKSLPSRYPGDLVIEVGDYITEFQKMLSLFREKSFELAQKSNSMSSDTVKKAFGYSAKPDDRPSFTDEEKELILNLCSYTTHIDFGDGVEHSGRKRNE